MVVEHYFFLICFLCLSVFSIHYFWLHWVFVAHRLSLVAESRGFSLVAVRGLLIAVASRYRARALGHTGFGSCAPCLVAPRHVGSS